MKIHRVDLDGPSSPAAIAARIHELVPELPSQVPLEDLCRQLDIASIKEIETDSFEAALIMDELKAAGAILLAANRPAQRRRFSIAHELGHFLLPSHLPAKDHPFSCSLADLHLLDASDGDRRRRVEAEANRFAAHLLVPPARVRKAIGQLGPGLQSIVAMAREFGVSKEAMARAWVEAHREPVAIIVAQHGRVLRQYRNADFPWLHARRGQRLPLGSLADKDLPPPGTCSSVGELEPEAWLTERDARRTLLLAEQVLAQREGFAMILLQAELDED